MTTPGEEVRAVEPPMETYAWAYISDDGRDVDLYRVQLQDNARAFVLGRGFTEMPLVRGIDYESLRARAERAEREGDSARAACHEWAAMHRTERERAERAEEDLRDVREERDNLLRDWNALVQAIGSPTHGGAVGYAKQLRTGKESAERERDALVRAGHAVAASYPPEHDAMRALDELLANYPVSK
jgi:hypothetical protein